MADNMRVTPVNVNVVSKGELPEMFTLRQNCPNQFNPSTRLKFDLPDSGNVSLVVYDVLGRQIDRTCKGIPRSRLSHSNLERIEPIERRLLRTLQRHRCVREREVTKVNKLVLMK